MTGHAIGNAIFHAALWRGFHAFPPLIALAIAAALAVWFLARARRP